MPEIIFLENSEFQFKERRIEVSKDTSILHAALEADIPIQHSCGGYCACTTCHVQVVEGQENLSVPDEEEQERISGVDRETPQSRLACQAKIKDGTVRVSIMNFD